MSKSDVQAVFKTPIIIKMLLVNVHTTSSAYIHPNLTEKDGENERESRNLTSKYINFKDERQQTREGY